MELTFSQQLVADEIEQALIEKGMTPFGARKFVKVMFKVVAEEAAFEKCIETLSAHGGNGDDYGYQNA